MDGPPLADALAVSEGSAAFYFNAPNLGRYVSTVRDDSPLRLDVFSPDGTPLLNADMVGPNAGVTMLLAPGRYSVRAASYGVAGGASSLQIAVAS